MALANIAAKPQATAALDQDRFCALWQRCASGAHATDSGLDVFAQLEARYREAHRHYHTPDHILHCLRQFDLARGEMRHPDSVELALWFHDVIYETQGGDNEARSAEWFLEVSDGRLDDDVRERVRQMIMVTVHPSVPGDDDQQLVVDIDLSSFALPWERFRRDSEAVRREMGHLDDKAFFSGQIRFLTSLLNREAFFGSRFFNRRGEQAACDNVNRYLAELSDRGFAAS